MRLENHLGLRLDHSWTRFLARTVAAQLHGIGLLIFLFEVFLLLPNSWKVGPDHFLACASYLLTGAVVFAVSSTYHFLHDGFQISPELGELLENLDHFSIYLFIAGTYTPFLLNAVSPPWRFPLLVGIWGIALVGIVYTWIRPRLPALLQHRILYTGLFVAMGWFSLVRGADIYSHLSIGQIGLLGGGAAAYCVGAVVYAIRWPTFSNPVFGYHELWHLMVLVGAQLHFLLILSFYSAS